MRTKEIKGITLIALAITIVTILVLVGVTINLVVGNEGLFNRAKSTQIIQTVAGIKEALELEKIDIQVESKTVDLDNYLDQISTGKKNYDISFKEKIDDKNAEIIVNEKYKFVLKDTENGDVEIIYQGVSAAKDLVLSATRGIYIYPDSGTFTVTNNTSGGKLAVSSDAPNIATASIDGNTITVKPETVAGKANIIVRSSANGEYAENKVIHVATVKNGTIELEAIPYDGVYDGKAHNAFTSVTTDPTDATIEYSTDGEIYSPTMPTITDTSSFTVTIKASKAGYKTITRTETTKVNKADGKLTLSATSGTLMYPNTTTFTVSGNTGSLSVSSNNNNIATASISGNTVTVKSGSTAGTAKITVTSAATANYNAKSATYSVTVTNINNLKIGDYVNYTYDTASTYTVQSKYSGYSNQTIKQTTGLKWKIVNIDKTTNTVDIVSENPTNTRVYFQGILGYNNGPYLMNEICKAQYSNKILGIYARSINLLDMEKHLTTKGISERNSFYNANGSAKYGKTKKCTGNNSYYPALYKNQKGAGINTTNVTQPSITKGNDPYEESKKITTTEPTTDSSYGQARSSGLTATQTDYFITINNDNYGEAASVLSNSNLYWIAARFVDTWTDYVYFGLRCTDTGILGGIMFCSTDKYTYDSGRYLRPLISLKTSDFTGRKNSSGAWNLK